MNKDAQLLCGFLDKFEHNPTKITLEIEMLDDDFKELGNKLLRLAQFISTAYGLSLDITAGIFTTSMDPQNTYAGPLKEIQSILHHLNWQVEQIANGDYNQRVDYLGEISHSFNNMIDKLKNREFLLKENARLQEEVLSQQTALLEYELQNQVEKYRQFSASVMELRAYRHDMKNHMICIDSMLHEQKIIEARKYISTISSVFQTQSQSEYGENYILGALLNQKIAKAEAIGVVVTKKIDIERKMHIENKDWCIIFGNALDNAIEALENVKERERTLDIHIKSRGTMLSARISNRMSGEIQQEGDAFITTKEDANMHGLGLGNIKHCVNAYHGEMKIELTKHTFSLLFVLLEV